MKLKPELSTSLMESDAAGEVCAVKKTSKYSLQKSTYLKVSIMNPLTITVSLKQCKQITK